VIDKLQNLELVERRSDPTDRRINRIYLTEKAESLYERMHECGISIIKSATKGIEQDQLNIVIEYLDKIINNLIISYNLESFSQEQITNTSNNTYKKSNKILKI
jgi:MarR family transcriptional regulator for hemolysin